MSDFFGKRGRRLHVSAVITSQGSIYINKFQIDNFVRLFNSYTQNSFAVNFAYYLAYAPSRFNIMLTEPFLFILMTLAVTIMGHSLSAYHNLEQEMVAS